ncbi:ABC-2 type transporter [Nostocoides japonicum T1-X7]|uniref:Transport permease protein n=1 Tax=Nostocoides japonicum T1-X7 TaxID=1194083 RepID=A0A077LZT0_9MICO|nr:ABC transporter permease [Tetrasphaera japonica]CCH77454.1 ABC-2 type transporter [Tetrasphaera japonica T1-X7]
MTATRVSSTGPTGRVAAVWQHRSIVRTLVVRDLRVRYARSWLGYLWTVLDPLLMSLIYFFVFTQIFHRSDVGHKPYFLFLVVGLLSWQFFTQSITDGATSLLADSKLVRSTSLPREVWVVRVVASKLVEYVYSLPVLVLFVAIYVARGDTHVNARIVLFPLGVALQIVMLVGFGLLLAPVTALVTDMQRVIRILLRMLFYATPVIYSPARVPKGFRVVIESNPMAGVLELQRAGLFKEPILWRSVVLGVAFSLVILGLGTWVFVRLERAVLKEI